MLLITYTHAPKQDEPLVNLSLDAATMYAAKEGLSAAKVALDALFMRSRKGQPQDVQWPSAA